MDATKFRRGALANLARSPAAGWVLAAMAGFLAAIMIANTGECNMRSQRQVTATAPDAHPLSLLRSWFDANLRTTEPIIAAVSATTVPFHIFVYHPSTDEYTSGEILQKGTWHRELIAMMESFILKRTAAGHLVKVLDIGANLGFFSLAAASLSPNVHVYAIEASPFHAKLVSASIHFNRFEDRITLFNKAVAAQPQPKPLTLCENAVGNRANTIILDKAADNHYCVDVEVSSVDTLLGSHTEIDAIKMDIEGFEPYALEGARKLFQRKRPGLIILEYKTITLKVDSTWAVNLLEMGYSALDFFTKTAFTPSQTAEFKDFLDHLKDHVPSGHTDIAFTLAE
jgi:FkbM family methyltransferase